MKLKRCSAEKLKRIAQRKQIICFGAGENLFYVFETYRKLKLEQKVAFIVDNNKSKTGKSVELNGCSVEVKPPDVLKEINLHKYIIIITALKQAEIFCQIQNICRNPGGNCYRAPNRRFELSGTIEKLMCKLPLKNFMVLNGEGDTCENVTALGKYMAENNYFNKYQLVWLCDHPERFKETRQEKYINRRAYMTAKSLWELIRYYYYTGRARYIIFENQMVRKMRTDQISIYLNHGSPPLKATKGIINLPASLNYAVSPSAFSTTIISEQYSINKERILECGSMRTDILFTEGRSEKLQKALGTDNYKKVILWVPTFRQRKNTNRVDTDRDLPYGIPAVYSEQEFEQMLCALEENETLLLFKPHLLQDLNCLKVRESNYFRIVIPQELEEWQVSVYDVMKFADAMITDYSTIAFDFMLLDRPIGYTIDDIAFYKLGFSVPDVQELMPGKKIRDIKGLTDFFLNVAQDSDEYVQERRSVSKLVHDYPDGNNCERFCKILGVTDSEKNVSDRCE